MSTKTVFLTMSKCGREHENSFTTLERAEADLFFSDYYLGSIVTETVDTAEFEEIACNEVITDEAANYDCVLSQVEQYRMVVAEDCA